MNTQTVTHVPARPPPQHPVRTLAARETKIRTPELPSYLLTSPPRS